MSLSAARSSGEQQGARVGKQMGCDRVTDMTQNAECKIRFPPTAAERCGDSLSGDLYLNFAR